MIAADRTLRATFERCFGTGYRHGRAEITDWQAGRASPRAKGG